MTGGETKLGPPRKFRDDSLTPVLEDSVKVFF